MVQCINTEGSSKCGPCPPGYLGDGKTCTFVGKCHVDNGGCSPNARCQGDNLFRTGKFFTKAREK